MWHQEKKKKERCFWVDPFLLSLWRAKVWPDRALSDPTGPGQTTLHTHADWGSFLKLLGTHTEMENNAGREGEKDEEEQVVNPWEVSGKDGGKIDYDKLIDKFGCQRLDISLIDRVQRLTSRPPHVFLRRGVFFAHRFLSLSSLSLFSILSCPYFAHRSHSSGIIWLLSSWQGF